MSFGTNSNVITITPLSKDVDKVHVSTHMLTTSTNLVEVGKSVDGLLFVRVEGDLMILSKYVNGKLLTLDFFTMVTGNAINNVDIYRLNRFNIILRYDDGIGTYYRCFTIFGNELVLTLDSTSNYAVNDVYIDELNSLKFMNGVLKEITYSNTTDILTSTDEINITSKVGESILYKTKLTSIGNKFFTFVFGSSNDYVIDMTNNVTVRLGTNSKMILGLEKVYILTQDNLEVFIYDTSYGGG